MDVATVRRKYHALAGTLTERSRRLWAATEARELGHGGIALVEEATGVSRSTITRGIREIEAGAHAELPPERMRRPGGGRKRTAEMDDTLLKDLDRLVEPMTRGDPESPLRWTAKSVRHLADELQAMGHDVSYRTVARLLQALDYSLQANRKTREGEQHADRDAQFRYIDRLVRARLRRGAPAISVDTKKKELVGDFKNPGREWRPKGQPEPVRVHDFLIPDQGKAIPYGVYDLSRDEGWVSVGIDHDTANFAVNAVRRWWKTMGRPVYADADLLLITADAGGSNGPRVRLWKWELQKFATRTRLAITVCHFPPGTSKWNKIEHRLFCHITRNWRGVPLETHQVVVNLVSSTRTEEGLEVHCQLDEKDYPKGRKISDAQMASLRIKRNAFHGDWNYEILPRRSH